jgi:DNA cross-link repair 1A protein
VEGDRDALKKGSGGGAQLVRQGEMMKGWLNKAKKEELEEQEMNGSLLLDENDDKKKVIVKAEGPKERLLVMVGTYSIGKERIVKGMCPRLARWYKKAEQSFNRHRPCHQCQDLLR